MKYSVFGPFNLYDARAISVSDPMECVPFEWGDRVHLEDVGTRCLFLGGDEKNGAESYHFGSELTTIKYKNGDTILCQINNPLSGVYVCSEEKTPIFSRGFEKLLEEKSNPESEINKALNERKMELRRRMDLRRKIGPLIKDKSYSQQIEQSGIFDIVDANIFLSLRSRTNPNYLSEVELIKYLEDFYTPHLFGRITHIGMALYYFHLPIEHLVKSAKEELFEAYRKHFPEDCSWLEEYLEDDIERRLFGS